MFPAVNPQPKDVQAQLAELDLTVDDLLIPVVAGARARRTATRNHPKAFPGWLDYGERVAMLRERLLPNGWFAMEPDNMSLVVHPDSLLAIMTAVGNEGTGTLQPVSTKRSRGEMTNKVVAVNALQLELALNLIDLIPTAPTVSSGIPTWMLLTRTEGDEIRSELSLPLSITSGYVDTWAQRIQLPVVLLNQVSDSGEPDDDGGHEFDVVER